MSDCTSGLCTNWSVNWDSPTLLATSDDAMANCMLNLASNAVVGRIAQRQQCISRVETRT